MAKQKCKECEGMGSDCKCPPKKGNKRYSGWYGRDMNDTDMDGDHMDYAGDAGGGVSEGIRMPKAPSDADKSMRGSSREKKEKTLSNFKAAADDAKKRQKYKDENDELRATTIRKGVRFYDSKGSGYIKGGKKTYD